MLPEVYQEVLEVTVSREEEDFVMKHRMIFASLIHDFGHKEMSRWMRSWGSQHIVVDTHPSPHGRGVGPVGASGQKRKIPVGERIL